MAHEPEFHPEVLCVVVGSHSVVYDKSSDFYEEASKHSKVIEEEGVPFIIKYVHNQQTILKPRKLRSKQATQYSIQFERKEEEERGSYHLRLRFMELESLHKKSSFRRTFQSLCVGSTAIIFHIDLTDSRYYSIPNRRKTCNVVHSSLSPFPRPQIAPI